MRTEFYATIEGEENGPNLLYFTDYVPTQCFEYGNVEFELAPGDYTAQIEFVDSLGNTYSSTEDITIESDGCHVQLVRP